MSDNANHVDGFVQLLPLVPLHKLVIFPYMNAAFEVSDNSNLSAFEGAMNEGREVFLVTHQVDAVGVPEFDAFNKVGTITRIKSILRAPTGPVRITVEGLRRAKFLSIQNLPTGQHAEVQDFPREESTALLMTASRGVLLDFFH